MAKWYASIYQLVQTADVRKPLCLIVGRRYRAADRGKHGRFRNCTWYFFALVFGSVPAAAHHPSGITLRSSGGPIVTIPGTTMQQGAFSAFVNFEYTSFDELRAAVLEAAAGRHEHVHSLATIQSPSTGFAYGMTDRLMLSLMLPYVVRTDIREGHHHHGAGGVVDNQALNRGDTKGIGDLTLLGQYRFLGRGNFLQASVLAGFKAPTGTTSERDREGELFESEFQPGTGSWDGLIGLAATKPLGRWSLDGNVLYTVASEGAHQTDLGDRFHYNSAVSYRLFGSGGGEEEHAHSHYGRAPQHGHRHDHQQGPQSIKVDLALELNGEWQAKQVEGHEKDQNSGGNVVFLSPGIRVSGDRLSGYVSVGVPIINDLNGIQAEPNYRVVGGLLKSF